MKNKGIRLPENGFLKDGQGGQNYGNGNYKQLQQLCNTGDVRKRCCKQHEEEGNEKNNGNSKSKGISNYVNELAKPVPSVELNPAGDWKIWIETTGDVSTATITLTVNYRY